MRGIEYFRRKLTNKRRRVLLRYKYYEQKQNVRDFSTIPGNMSWLKCTQGWCTKAVDSLADRLQFRGFRDDNFYLEEIFQMNNPDVLFPAAIRSAREKYAYSVPGSVSFGSKVKWCHAIFFFALTLSNV